MTALRNEMKEKVLYFGEGRKVENWKTIKKESKNFFLFVLTQCLFFISFSIAYTFFLFWVTKRGNKRERKLWS